MNLLWSKENSRNSRGYINYPAKNGDGPGTFRYRRVDEVNRRMRQWLANPVPLKDNLGRDVPPYMQLDTIQKPKFIKLLTGEVFEYDGP